MIRSETSVPSRPAGEDPLALAEELLLRPAGLDIAQLERTLGQVLAGGVDAADLYFQLSRDEGWSLEDGIVKEGSASIEQGFGVRALSGEKTGFAYSDEILPEALAEAARAARAIAAGGREGRAPVLRRTQGHALYPAIDPVGSLSDDDKVRWLERVDRETRRVDPRIVQVMASVSTSWDLVLIADGEGTLAADVRPLVRFNVSVIAEQDGRRETGFAGMGGRYSLTELVAGDRPLALGREAARQALVNLTAVPAPAGPASCCTRPSAMVLKATSTARAPRRSAAASESASLPRSARWSTTAPCPRAVVRSTSTTKARRHAAPR